MKLKKWTRWVVLSISLVLAGILLARALQPSPAAQLAQTSNQVAQVSVSKGDGPILPLPLSLDLDSDKVALGRQLFHDPGLSSSGKMSCASCHDIAQGGEDGLPQSLSNKGTALAFNAPTVLNSGFNFRQFWNGRANTLEAQIDVPILDSNEMNQSWTEVVAYLKRDRDYVSRFRKVYRDAPTPDAVRDAIATFERSLVTPNARFDQYLRGDQTALTDAEKEGYARFQDYGCVACHQGINLGGNLYQRLGVVKDFFSTRDTITDADKGRLNVTGRMRDRYLFKVPTLRNIELTAPYLHDGSIQSLTEIVQLMGTYQLGREIPPTDVDLIVQFLKTLTGEQPTSHE